jgi:hypothetical protein
MIDYKATKRDKQLENKFVPLGNIFELIDIAHETSML